MPTAAQLCSVAWVLPNTLPCVFLCSFNASLQSSKCEGRFCLCLLSVVVSAWSSFITRGMNWRPYEFPGWHKTRSSVGCLRWPKRGQERREVLKWLQTQAMEEPERLPLLPATTVILRNRHYRPVGKSFLFCCCAEYLDLTRLLQAVGKPALLCRPSFSDS